MRWWLISQCRVRASCVAVDAPILDNHLCLPEAVEDFPIQTFIPEFLLCRPASLQAMAIVLPCPCSTSIWRSFVTICSAASLFLAIFFLLSSSILSHRLVQKKQARLIDELRKLGFTDL